MIDPKRICILGVFDESYAELAYSSVNDNWRRYADNHGYVVKAVKCLFPQGPTSWYKVFHLRETLATGRYDWVCYFDTDILFTNMERPLQNYLDDRVFLAGADDVDELNQMIGAQLCFRNCQESLDFLDELWERRSEFTEHPWEQIPLAEMCERDEYKDKIRRWSGTNFHSFFPCSDIDRVTAYPSSTLLSWFPGSYTCHFTCMSTTLRGRRMYTMNEWLKEQETEIAEHGAA